MKIGLRQRATKIGARKGIAIEPGLHRYMFLIDGSNWVTDPTAERYADDGFGNRNAVLAVTTPTA